MVYYWINSNEVVFLMSLVNLRLTLKIECEFFLPFDSSFEARATEGRKE